MEKKIFGPVIFDLAKAQYESKNMLDAELLDGLIKERIVLQYGEKIEDIITEEDVEKKPSSIKSRTEWEYILSKGDERVWVRRGHKNCTKKSVNI